MKIMKKLSAILLVLCLALTLCACGGEDEPDVPNDTENGDKPSISPVGNTTIEMPYDDNYTFNPLTSESTYNRAVCDLLFENFLELDDELNPVPNLCESFATDDGINYKFTVFPDIKFHDGSFLTADDVIFSIKNAREHDLYAYRFSCIDSMGADSDTELHIALKSVNYSFPALMSIKIVKKDSTGTKAPIGTGPYYYDNSGEKLFLRRFLDYRDDSAFFTDKIGLVDKSTINFSDAFGNGDIDIISIDPDSDVRRFAGGNCDIYYFNTTTLQYIGFNYTSSVCEHEEIRHAISMLIDRSDIAKNCMNGTMQPATLLLNPALCGYYDAALESGRGYSVSDAIAYLNEKGLKDNNGDGWLDYPRATDYLSFTLEFIVNRDNEYRVAAAEAITEELRSVGIRTELKLLSWNEYVKALENEDYSMYFAEVQIAPDYDFLPLLSPDGTLNFGGIKDRSYEDAVNAMFSAPDALTRAKAAGELCKKVYDGAPIIPIGYSRGAVMAHRKQLEGFAPRFTNLFFRKTSD